MHCFSCVPCFSYLGLTCEIIIIFRLVAHLHSVLQPDTKCCLKYSSLCGANPQRYLIMLFLEMRVSLVLLNQDDIFEPETLNAALLHIVEN